MGLSVIRWIGGKGHHWQWIVKHLPPGKIYVEPFGGAASVLLNKQPHPIEVYNDINSDLVNLFRAIQDEERFDKLFNRLLWTSYSLDEFRKAIEIIKFGDDPDERAWAFFVIQNQSFGGVSARSEGRWGRTFTPSNGYANNCSRWNNTIANLHRIRERFMKVQIDNRNALDVIDYWDTEETVFYIDPPYPHDTRKSSNDYQHEMSDDDHQALLDKLYKIRGSFAVSTYKNIQYDQLLQIPGAKKVERQTSASVAARTRETNMKGKGSATSRVPRTEVLYLKYNIQGGLL